jgi:hypothetical protein
MPNKTIYIRDADTKLWDEAQKQLGGESISSILTDCLKERLRTSKTVDNVQAMNELLAELNDEHKMALELHPFWSPVILDANSLDVGFKLHQKRATPDRVMSLIVDPLNFGRSGRLTKAATKAITAEVLEFWAGKRTDNHAVVRVGDLEIRSRLLNLVGKQGLVNIARAGEINFTIMAVHPAEDLPESGNDDDLQEAINRSEFSVRFEDGVFVEGSNSRVISGRYISLIRGRY